MANGAVLCLLFVSGLCQKGLAAVIETQQTVMAAVGEEALLNCQLMQPKDVLQVSWQKVLPEGGKNLASYNKYFGQKVNDGFQDKVEFKDAGLLNCSIVIRRVTEEDEGCYRCLYSTYPHGAFIARTCLQLYELHEPVLHVRESNSPEEVVVSCSATGRPAPTVRLTVLHYNSTSVTNTNATVTVTATAVLPRLHGNSTQVGCAVQVLSGPQIEVFTMIPEVTLLSADGEKHLQRSNEESGSDKDVTLIIVLVVVMSFVCVAIIIAGLLIQKHRNCLSHRDSEKNKTPQKTTKDTEEPRTPLLSQENEVRQRMSTGKKKENVSPKESSLRAGCQRQLSQQFTDTQ
ncbi:nectin-1-like isoform X2 [Epinephelus lanceolatus]